MPAKIARSAPRPPFGLPQVTVAVRTSLLSCRKAEKTRVFTPVSGVIWRIPVKNYILIYLRGVRLADLLPDAATTHAGIEQGSFAEPSHPSSDELH